jgi:hypothetical protein
MSRLLWYLEQAPIPSGDEVPSAPACVAMERRIGLVPQIALPVDRPDVRPPAQQVQWNASPEVGDGRSW